MVKALPSRPKRSSDAALFCARRVAAASYAFMFAVMRQGEDITAAIFNGTAFRPK